MGGEGGRCVQGNRGMNIKTIFFLSGIKTSFFGQKVYRFCYRNDISFSLQKENHNYTLKQFTTEHNRKRLLNKWDFFTHE